MILESPWTDKYFALGLATLSKISDKDLSEYGLRRKGTGWYRLFQPGGRKREGGGSEGRARRIGREGEERGRHGEGAGERERERGGRGRGRGGRPTLCGPHSAAMSLARSQASLCIAP